MTAFDDVNKTFCDAQSQKSFLVDGKSSILTNGQSIGLAVSIPSSAVRLRLNRAQLTAEASFLSFGAITVIFILIVVCSISFQPCCPI
jgi:hypothetical protein